MEINLKNLKPYKKLGKGSENIVIITNNSKLAIQ
jgi:hypothetical protein